MNLMRKLMNLDEFQCPPSVIGSGGTNNNNNNNNNNANTDASKQFHPYTNGVFNGKMLSNSTTNFAFPYDKQPQQQQQQHHMNGIRNHDGLLKPCYDFSVSTKSEPLDDNFNTAVGFSSKKSSLFNTPPNNISSNNNNGNGGFMNQFAHHDYHGNHQVGVYNSAKINEINNNNSSGGGIVVKLENGGDFNTMQISKSEILCARSGVVAPSMVGVVSKTEPNEFRSNNCKENNNHVDTDDERKTSLHPHDHDSNDGFTQL